MIERKTTRRKRVTTGEDLVNVLEKDFAELVAQVSDGKEKYNHGMHR